jgi:transposase-like protein
MIAIWILSRRLREWRVDRNAFNYNAGMTSATDPDLYKRHRYPTEIVAPAVWIYFRFPLSYRDVEELLAAHGIHVTDETIRQWCRQLGQTNANQVRQWRSQPGDKWHPDEVFRKINGETWHIWRAVNQYGEVLDILVTSKHDKQAAKRSFRKLLKDCLPVAQCRQFCRFSGHNGRLAARRSRTGVCDCG